MVRPLTLLCLALAAVCTAASGNAGLPDQRYAICAAEIESAVVEELSVEPGRFAIGIRLSNAAAAELKAATGRAIGEDFALVWDGLILQRARIVAPVGGLMAIGEWRSKEAAERLLALMRDPALKVPCGLQR